MKANILFGSPYDETRYKKVIYQCGLERDISLFEAGDQAEVGEKGLTLSGGQKARVTLARAIYSQAQIILLDDGSGGSRVSMLCIIIKKCSDHHHSVHTAKWIVDKCFTGDLTKGRTIILVVSECPCQGYPSFIDYLSDAQRCHGPPDSQLCCFYQERQSCKSGFCKRRTGARYISGG